MKYSLVTLSALAAFAVAEQPKFLNTEFNVKEGQDFPLKFSGCASTCTISLRKGPSNNLETVQSLTTSASGGVFNFSPKGLPSDTYAFEIKDNASGEVNYSVQFPYQGTGAVVSSAVSSAAMTASPTTASATKMPASSSLVSSAAMTSVATSAPVMSVKPVATSMVHRNTTMATSSARTSAALTSGMSTSTAPRPTGPATQVPTSDVGRLSAPLALAVGLVAAAFFG
ncbi:hypothetical protein CDD81_4343 [Ophiocordyceps australis]|uniref:Yeast cell wall synthesis Kre9/Knh1-like N-terminal domain-containing protein n=1 Tax=Ophiocordyceps australis TaxID=1399860 RepID=A0A2C5YC76_9HYPO|nr:hypothetical protein CDD81_4343 [Ophiocordyceps australis]